MDNQWLSITEVAKEMNVSYQAVYKRLNTNFKPYVKKVKGKLMLNAEILDEYKVIKVEKKVNQVQYKVENQEVIDVLNDHIKSLKKELDEKDIQIKNLHELLDKSLKNQSQSNFVLAQHQQQTLIGSEAEAKTLSWFKRIFQNK